jgi:iron complex transport system ATP-binding protein
MSLHDVNLAARYCDQAILLYPGGEVEAGPAAGLLRAETLSRVYRHPVRALPAGERTVFHPG